MTTARRALVIGAGETSTLMHLPVLAALRDRGRLELVEICDLRCDRAEATARRFRFARAGGDGLAALQRGDIDVVYLFGDARLHHDYGLAALKAGKHLFVEKPIAPSYAEAAALAQVAEDHGLIAVGGHNRRFYRSLTQIRARGGKAGWRLAEATFHKPLSGPAPFGARSWLTANGIHALDAMVFVMGALPEQLTAHADGERFSALMRWPGGAQGVFLCDNQTGSRREGYAFHASGLSCTADEQGLRIQTPGSSSFIPAPAIGDGFDAEHVAFLDAIDQGIQPLHGLSDLAPSLRLAELIEEGFSGRIEWPKARRARAARPQSFAPGTLLVVNAPALKAALDACPPGRPLVAIDELIRIPGARPDITGVLIGTGPQVLTAEILDRLPNLAVAGLVGLSFARHRPDLLLDRGVSLVNASEAYADSVAEFALGLAILARRRAFASDRIMRQGGWGTVPRGRRAQAVIRSAAQALRPALARIGLEPLLLKLWRRAHVLHAAPPRNAPRELAGATAGLIGWGANGRALALRLAAAGVRVLAWSEHAEAEEIQEAGAERAALAEVLDADIVSLHRGLTPATRHFLGAAELARLKPGAVLINVARGALVEPKALLARLRQGDIFACLDTFEEEPLPAGDPMRRLPNVFLTSHIAGGSADMQTAAAREVLGKITRHLKGEAASAIARDRLATMT